MGEVSMCVLHAKNVIPVSHAHIAVSALCNVWHGDTQNLSLLYPVYIQTQPLPPGLFPVAFTPLFVPIHIFPLAFGHYLLLKL